MLLEVLLLLVGFALLLSGAEGFVRGASGLALHFRVPEYVVGATIVALGTSLPEALTSGYAAFRGNVEISVSNVVGSNIFNVAMILGVAALITPIHIQRAIFERDAPPFLTATFALVLVALDRRVERVEGVILLILLFSYVFWLLLEREEPSEELRAFAPPLLWLSLLLVVGGALGLYLGARLTVGNAVALAKALGVSEWVIGVTVVAAGTSLPELITSVVAALRKRQAIAVGNIIGSNIFNIYFILGLAACIRPLPVSRAALLFDIPTTTLLSLLLVFMVYDRRITRESGFSLLGLFLIFIFTTVRLH